MTKISVLIATRNRDKLIDTCLQSLANQTKKPYEVIIIDNNSKDRTKKTIDSYRKVIPIIYKNERNIGLPYCRNTAMKLAKGDVCAFLDDDCIADSSWIATIEKHFYRHPQSQGVLGLSKNYYPENPHAAVEQIFFVYWLLQNIRTLDTCSPILDGKVIDFKNCAFKTNLIKSTVFSTAVPFGDVGNEDVEVGERLLLKEKHIFFDPNIVVYHKNSSNFLRLITKNFWKGVSDQKLLLHNTIDIRKTPLKPVTSWLSLGLEYAKHNNSLFKQITFLSILLIYPFFSRIGRLYARLFNLLSIETSIPQRE